MISFMIGFLSAILMSAPVNNPEKQTIRHSVVFRLVHEKGSVQEKEFFDALDKLTRIPGVTNFNYREEISAKNEFDYILFMDFADQKTYDRYNAHPLHINFVEQVWLKQVAAFLEIDYLL